VKKKHIHVAARWLVPRLGRFRHRWPDADLLIDPSTRLADLQRGEVDVAIRYGRGRYPGLHSQRLLGEALFPVCSPQPPVGV
jgi:LysR family glycine cleavage system transcriptional activator